MLPMLVAAWWFKIYPTRLWVLPLGIIAISTTTILLNESIAWGIAIVDGILLAVAFIDFATLLGRSKISVTRQTGRVASLAKPHEVTLQIDHVGNATFQLVVRDDLPTFLTASPSEFRLQVKPRTRFERSYSLNAGRRGKFELERVYFRRSSLLGLWHRFFAKEVTSEIHVYPDMKQLGEYALLARTNRLSLIGVRRTRKLGQDNNFERLRDYTKDDNYKHIDWRSTARRRKLTVKQFQADQSQRIFFLLDCGRMMTNEHDNLSLVDYALNSILLLSYVALSQGDSVGMVCFSDRILDYVPMRGGQNQMNQMLHAGFNQFPQFVQSRFDQAFLHVSNHCRKRSLVVLVTNVIDEVSAAQVTGYMQNLGGRHLPLLALLRDHRMFDFANHPTLDDEVLFRSAAAAEILNWRHSTLKRLEKSGSLVVDAFPDDLTSPMINSYLEVKAKHLL